MYILGLNSSVRVPSQDSLPGWSNHDAAAALLHDDVIIAAVEEERLDRIKHSSHFPYQAINACLDIADITPGQLDVIAVNFEGRGPVQADGGEAAALSAYFQKYVGNVSNAKLKFVHHQLAHLFSAYIPSGFDECIALSLDGVGDKAAGAIGLARDGEIEILDVVAAEHSLGEFYRDTIRVLAYNRFDEYKVMALAALGDDRAYADLFSSFFELREGGRFTLAHADLRRLAISECIQARRSPKDQFTQSHYDFAASLQTMITRVVMHHVDHFRGSTGIDRIAMAGGVMHNCAINGSLLASGLFSEVFVQPAAHDAGGALGAAYASLPGSQRQAGLRAARGSLSFHLSLGKPLPAPMHVQSALSKWSDLVEIEKLEDPFDVAAHALDRGEVIGWMQGRSEFGPRALGYRSILADPRRTALRDRINSEIKQREPFQPFAPAVLEEQVWSIFSKPAACARLDYMTFLLKLLPNMEELYPAITHADGTARVQSVGKDSNPRLHALISRFYDLTGAPLLLNTSFNARGEPIVDSVDDAVSCLLLTGIDLLVIDDFAVRAIPGKLEGPSLGRLSPALPLSRKIVFRSIPGEIDGTRSYFLETTFSRHFGGGNVRIPEAVARMLMIADGRKTISSLRDHVSLLDDAASDFNQTIIELWRDGHVRLRPISTT
ncbi:carbamoyltransferase [Xanthobacter sp. AM11]|uniref:carbamoyltransferase family protein n=1 Tax=Xanthobacter sp. AM11 TaxID=3380643 RepID=UPI0039BF039A